MMEFIVIVEAKADAIIATELADRVLRAQAPDWLQDLFDQQTDSESRLLPFCWTGLEPKTAYSCWKDIAQILKNAQRSGMKIPQKLGWGKAGYLKTDGVNAFKVLELVRQLRKTRSIRGVILIRDQDNQPERRQHLAAVRAQGNYAQLVPGLAIVIGVADPKREAWVLNGFVTQTTEEEKNLAEVKQNLKFDPCLEAQRLRGDKRYSEQRERDAKVVLAQLTGEQFEREQQCWQETDLALLRDRGQKTGLTDYLQEIAVRLSPMILQDV